MFYDNNEIFDEGKGIYWYQKKQNLFFFFCLINLKFRVII